MVLLEELVRTKLHTDGVSQSAYLMLSAPILSDQNLSILPTPAVHIFHNESITHRYIKQTNESVSIEESRSSWIIIVTGRPVSNNVSLQNPLTEAETIRCMIQASLTGWSPQVHPFFTGLNWSEKPMQTSYDLGGVGMVFMPMLLETGKYFKTLTPY